MVNVDCWYLVRYLLWLFNRKPTRFWLGHGDGLFLLTMVMGGQKNLRIVVIWIVAAVVAILAYWYLPENMHVVVGALAGGLVGVLWKDGVKS